MNITVDTNVLVRAVMMDDAVQARAAKHILMESQSIAVTLPCLCEFVWVLAKVYELSNQEIAESIRLLLNLASVRSNRPAVEAGLIALDNNQDFADAVISFEGTQLGGEIFVSFDKSAVRFLQSQKQKTLLL